MQMATSTTFEEYLSQIPSKPAKRLAAAIQKTLRSIAEYPLQGAGQSELTRLLGLPVHSRVVSGYRIIYHLGGRYPEIIAILHTTRDIRSIMAKRLQ
jgi:plasmid stabilization system protein ParE